MGWQLNKYTRLLFLGTKKGVCYSFAMRITRRLDVAADRIRVRPQMQPAKTLQCDNQAGIPVAWSIKGAILSVKHQMATIDGLGQSRPSHDGEARDKAAGQNLESVTGKGERAREAGVMAGTLSGSTSNLMAFC